MPTTIALLGAGLAGLAAAQALTAHGARVTLFDKGAFPGGRLATRRYRQDATITFDHGAQYFTAKTARFRSLVERWQRSQVVAPWDARIVSFDHLTAPPRETDTSIERFVGVPHMNRLAEHLAEGLDLHLSAHVERLERFDSGAFGVTLQGAARLPQRFDAAIVNMPPAQAEALLQGLNTPALLEVSRAQVMRPCWATMALLDEPLDGVPFDAAFVNIEGHPLSWASRDSSKPQRLASGERWVLHASHRWSAKQLERHPDAIASALWEAWRDLLDKTLALKPHRLSAMLSAHRWRYAIPARDQPGDLGAQVDPEAPLLLCGDWLAGGRVEGAFLCGLDAAFKLMRRLDLDPSPQAIEALRPGNIF